MNQRMKKTCSFFTLCQFHQQSFVVDAAGLSVATSELIKMLDQDRPRSIKEFFIELKQMIPKAVEIHYVMQYIVEMFSILQ